MNVYYTTKVNTLFGFFYTDEYTTGKEVFHDIIEVYEHKLDGSPVMVKDIRYPNDGLICQRHELKVRTDENGVHYILWKGERVNLEDYMYYDIPTVIEKIEHGKEINDRWYISNCLILTSLMKNPDKFGVMIKPRYAQFIFPGTSIGITTEEDETPIPFIPREEPMRMIKDWFYKIKFVAQDAKVSQYTASEEYYFDDFCSLLKSGHLTLFEIK